jgi:ubiquitin C-terminal hydrolase
MANSNSTILPEGNLTPRQPVSWTSFPLYTPLPSSATTPRAIHDHIHRSHSEQPVIERQFSRPRPPTIVGDDAEHDLRARALKSFADKHAGHSTTVSQKSDDEFRKIVGSEDTRMAEHQAFLKSRGLLFSTPHSTQNTPATGANTTSLGSLQPSRVQMADGTRPPTANSFPVGRNVSQRVLSPPALDPTSAPNKRRTFEPWQESIGEAVFLEDKMKTGWDAREMHLSNQRKMKYASSFNELEFTTPLESSSPGYKLRVLEAERMARTMDLEKKRWGKPLLLSDEERYGSVRSVPVVSEQPPLSTQKAVTPAQFLKPTPLKSILDPDSELRTPKLSTHLSRIQSLNLPCGLGNLGNTCFINSVVQCLASSQSLAKSLNSKSEIGILVDGLTRLLTTLSTHSGSVHNPKDFLTCLWRHQGPNSYDLRRFTDGQQHDVGEFCLLLLNGLQYELGLKPQLLQMNHPTQTTPSSVIDDFEGNLRITTLCLNCKRKDLQNESFKILSLQLPSGQGPFSLNECLNFFCGVEILETYKCPGCKVVREAERSLSLQSLPKNLIVQLVRFKGDALGTFEKNSAAITFPADQWVVTSNTGSRQAYELSAVSNHVGPSEHEGHCTAFRKNHLLGSWYNCD